jgi:GTPase SAR1 family protein
METSALSNLNIEKAFRQMIEEIYKKYQKNFQENIDEDDLGHSENVFDIQQNIGNRRKTNTKLDEAKDKFKKTCCKS